MKLLLTNHSETLITKEVVYASSENDLHLLVKLFAPASFDLIESNQPITA